MEPGMRIRPTLFARSLSFRFSALGLAGLLAVPGLVRAQEPAMEKPTLAVLPLQGAFQFPQQLGPGAGAQARARRWGDPGAPRSMPSPWARASSTASTWPTSRPDASG